MVLAFPFADIAGLIVGLTVSITAIVSFVAKFKSAAPIRWVLQQLVVQPAQEALDRHLDEKVVVMEEKVVDSVGDAIQTSLAGLTDQVDRLGAVVASIRYEMFPNTGKSMRDVLDRVEETTLVTQNRVEGLQEDVAQIRDRTSRLEGNMDVMRDDRQSSGPSGH